MMVVFYSRLLTPCPLSSLRICQMKHIWYKLRHSLKVVLFLLLLLCWEMGVLVFPSKKDKQKKKQTHRGYFVKFVQQFFFSWFLLFLMDNNATLTTRQVWLKLWIIIEPLCFSSPHEHSDSSHLFKQDKPLMMPHTQCHVTRGGQWSGKQTKKYVCIYFYSLLVGLPGRFSLCRRSSLRWFPQ